MVHSDFKDLYRTVSNKVLCDKAFDVAKNPKYGRYQCGLASMVSTLFDKKSATYANKSAFGGASKCEIMLNLQSGNASHKPINKNLTSAFIL